MMAWAYAYVTSLFRVCENCVTQHSNQITKTIERTVKQGEKTHPHTRAARGHLHKNM